MKKERADELNNRILSAYHEGGPVAAQLVTSNIQRGMNRWDLFTMYLWKAAPYLKPRYPHMWKVGLMWLHSAFYFLFFKQRTRW